MHSIQLSANQHTQLRAQNTITVDNSQLSANDELYIESKGQLNNINSQLIAKNTNALNPQGKQSNNTAGIILIADQGISNTNSELDAGSLVQIADKGSIINDQTTQLNISNDIFFKAEGDITTWDKLNVSNNITLDAGQDLNNHGKDLTAGNDITLNAKRDINITALAETVTNTQSNMRTQFGSLQAGTETTNTSTTQRSSTITAGGDIALNSGRNILLEGSYLKAQGDVSLIATNDVTLRSAQNSTGKITIIKEVDYVDGDGGYQQKTTTKNNRSNSLVGSSIQSGANIIIDAGNNLLSQGAALTAADALALRAGNDLSIEAQALSNQDIKVDKNGEIIIDRVDYTASTLNANDIALVSGLGDIAVKGSQVNAKNNLNVDAQGQFKIERIQNTADTATTTTTRGVIGSGDDSYYGEVTKTSKSHNATDLNSQFSAGNDININTGTDTLITGQAISANNNVNINAQGNILLDTTTKTVTTGDKNGKDYTERTTHTTSDINAGNNINLNAQNDLTLKGSKLNANNIALNANNELNVLNVQDDYYSYKLRRSGNALTGRKSTTTEKLTTTNVASSLNAAGNITLNSRINEDGSISQTGTGDVNVISSDLNANNNVIIAGNDINILAQKEINYNKKVVKKSSLLGLKKSKTTTTRKEELLRASHLNALEDDVNLLAQNNINIVASNLSAGDDMTFDAKNTIDIQAGHNQLIDEYKKETSGVLSGGALYRKTTDVIATEHSTAVNSQLQGDNITLNAGQTVQLMGTDLNAQNAINANAQNIVIENAQNQDNSAEKHQDLKLGFSNPADMISLDDGKLSMTVGSLSLDDTLQRIKTNSTQESTLNANSINLNAQSREESSGNINIKGSSLNAEVINLDASQNVTIENSLDSTTDNKEEIHGKGELKVVVTNEYNEAAKAIEAVEDAKDVLDDSQQALSDFKKELVAQQQNLNDLQQQVDNGSGVITQTDIDELQGHINQLKDDEDYYKSNIALATSGLATATTAAAAQMSKAAASSVTYGFNVGVELELDALKEQFYNLQQSSVASNLNANNITINAGNTTTIKGSNVNANDTLAINSQNLEIQAAQTNNRSSSSSDHQNGTLSMDVYGATNPQFNIDGPISMSASSDQSQQNSQSTEYNNSQLTANSIQINVQNETTIKGGNINANEQLILNTNKLTLESLQNTHQSSGSSQGLNVAASANGLSSGGANNGNHSSNSTQTVLSSITGKNVDINVKEHTQVIGALIASQNADGSDANNLNLITNTLTTANLSNTDQSKSLNQGLTIGSTVGLDYQNNTDNSLTKTQSTIGQGNIQIGDTAKSDTTTLNRDTETVEVDIYDVSSQQGLHGELDTNLLTAEGRSKIQEDILKSGMILNSIQLIITTDRVGIEDFFKETEKSHTTYEAIKEEIRQDPELAKALQNPDLTATEKENMLDSITNAVLNDLGYATHNNVVIATDETGQDNQQVAGFFSTEDSDAYINDQNIKNTEGLVTTAGHEASHAMDMQDGIDVNNDDNRADNNTYATNYGENLASYTEGALNINGYDGGLADSNNHTGNATSQTIKENNQDFSGLDKELGDNRLTPEQEALNQQAIDECKTDSCRSAIRIESTIVSTTQGIAEAAGAIYQLADEITDSISETMLLVDTLQNNPEQAEAMAESFIASIKRIEEVLEGDNLTESEQQALVNTANELINAAEAFSDEVSELDESGIGGAFSEGKNSAALLAIVAGSTSIKRSLDGISLDVNPSSSSTPFNQYIDIVSLERREHILVGDGQGNGGHLWPGQQGKATFPENWSGDKIIHELGDIATSPNTKWFVQTGNGGKYTKTGKAAKWVAWETRNDQRIRVVYEPATGRIVTGFPDNDPIPNLKPIE